MSSVVDASRPSRRERQAQETRREIVLAARRLFAEQGYARTSLTQIAARAGVSVQTIYDSVGSKRGLVRALNDLVDEEGGVAELAARIPYATAPRELLEVPIAITRNINERCADIIGAVYSAASVEPELAAVRDESRRRHREGVGRIAEGLARLGALREGLTPDAAADIIAPMTDPAVVRTFVLAYGWSWDRWHEWARSAIADLVLAQPENTRASSSKRRRR